MTTDLPEDCMISLTDIPPDFEKHLKLVAERVQAMMVSLNEYNRDKDQHDGAVFLSCLMDALSSLYCDAENRPAAAVHLHSLTSVFSEGAGPVLAARCNIEDTAERIGQWCPNGPNIYLCIKGHSDYGNAPAFDNAFIKDLLQSTPGAVTVSELPDMRSAGKRTASLIARRSV